MKAKLGLSPIIFLLVGILATGFANALTFSSSSNILTETNKNASLILTNDKNTSQNVQLAIGNIVDGANQVTLSVAPTTVAFTASTSPQTQTVNINVGTISGNLKFGSHTAILTATGSGNDSANAQLTFLKSFCSRGTVGDLEINSIDIESNGDDDNEWRALDEITIDVEIENTGDDDVDDIIVELALFDSAGRNQANDLDFENSGEEELDLGNLNDGDEETVTFTFTLPADFETGSYKLAVKAYSEDAGQNLQCVDTSDDLDNTFYESIDVEREDDEGKFIAFSNIKISPDQVSCGESVTLTADVFNVGDEEQDQVKINLFSTELNLRLEKEIREDMEEGDKASVSFTFIVPQGLNDKLYTLELDANYDYRNGDYRESSDESTKTGLRVLGCTPGNPGQGSDRIALIAASLDSDAKAGEELAIKATITNLINEERDFVVRAEGFEDWATLQSLSDSIIHLRSGESKEITLRFNVDEDSSGEQSFNLEVISGNRNEVREIVANIEAGEAERPGFKLEGNSLLWVIGIINVVLIILIVIVAIRISRR